MPKFKIKAPMLMQAAEIYTHNIFQLFQIECGGESWCNIKLLPYDLIDMDLSRKNNLLQYKIKLHIINLSLGLHIDGSFVYQIAFQIEYEDFMLININKI